MSFHNLALILPICIMLHVTEEFLWPGGFSEWYQKLVPSKSKGIRPGYLVWINTLMIGVCVLPAWFGPNRHGINIWYTVATIAGVNAIFHITGVIKLKIYSPGVITGTLLYLPLFIYSCYTLLSTGAIDWLSAIVILAATIGYHIFSVYRQAR